MTNSSWHSTDDEVVVPINRTSSAHAPASSSIPLSTQSPAPSDRMRMGLSAMIGIVGVLFVLSFFFDITTLLQGSLTPSDRSSSVSSHSSDTVVTITKDGVFEPSTLAISAGKSLTFINKHPDPQVLKTLSGSSLFPAQVIFTDPVRVTLPSTATGSSSYYSETLPPTSLLQITIVDAAPSRTIESLATSSLSSSSPSIPAIPIPFADDAPSRIQPEVVQGQLPSSPSVSAPTLLSVQSSPSPQAVVPMNNTALPRNTYTLATRSNRLKSTSLASTAKTTPSRLHGGAPLRPRVIASTGVETWLMCLIGCIAFFGTSMMFRRVV